MVSGVPQGSVLGPVLFNIYVNDMPLHVNSVLLQFADDVKMFRSVKSLNDFQQLQLDIDRLVAWSKLWQLNFNVCKCNLLHFGPPHNYGNYHIDGSVTLPSDSVKDLGILIDDQFKFHKHSLIVAGRANRTLAVIWKSFDKETF